MSDSDSDGKALWDIQHSFNDKFFKTKGGWPTADRLTDESKNFAIHLIKEATEVLDELSFKMHRAGKGEVDRDNILEELVDVQKFLWGWMQIWNFSYDQFVDEFKRKSMVVEQRFAFEQSLPVLVNHPVALIDIDGCLAEYPGYFYDWAVANYYPTHSRHEFKRLYDAMPLLARENIKTAYRQSGAKAMIPLLPGAKEFLQTLRRKSNIKIVLYTNRPYNVHYRIYPDTLEWLETNDLPHDGIVWSIDKGVDGLKLFKNIVFAVEDTLENVLRLQRAGITTIGIDSNVPGRTTLDLYKLAERTDKLEDLGYLWCKEIGKEVTR